MEIGVAQIGYEMALAFLSLFLGVSTILTRKRTEGFASLDWFGAAFLIFAASTSLTATGVYLRVAGNDPELGLRLIFISNLVVIPAFYCYAIGLQHYVRRVSLSKYINLAFLAATVFAYSFTGQTMIGRYLISLYLLYNIYLGTFRITPQFKGALNTILGGLWTAVVIFLFYEPISALVLAVFGDEIPFQYFVYYGLSILFFMQIGLGVFRLVAQIQSDQLNKLATLDPLTQALNRRSLHEIAQRETARADRYQRDLTVVMLDLDHFKQINDTWGHAAGDLVLKETAALINTFIRTTDYLFRFGGEEFLILLTETNLESAAEYAEKVRQRIADLSIPDYPQLSLTVSIGLSRYQPGGKWEEAVKRADEALYTAKESGRNRVVKG